MLNWVNRVFMRKNLDKLKKDLITSTISIFDTCPLVSIAYN